MKMIHTSLFNAIVVAFGLAMAITVALANQVPKGATCPAPQVGVFGACIEACTRDGDCIGPGEKCCSNGCGHSCINVAPHSEPLPNECATVVCPPEHICYPLQRACFTTPCPQHECRPITCANNPCPNGHTCHPRQIVCITAPCLQYECRPSTTTGSPNTGPHHPHHPPGSLCNPWLAIPRCGGGSSCIAGRCTCQLGSIARGGVCQPFVTRASPMLEGLPYGQPNYQYYPFYQQPWYPYAG